MTLIDKIKADREAGTQGKWQADGIFMENGNVVRIAIPDINGVPQGTIAEAFHDWQEDRISLANAEANARRIARVPDMEAALLAADALGLAIDDVASVDNAGVVATALAAYRKAIGDA